MVTQFPSMVSVNKEAVRGVPRAGHGLDAPPQPFPKALPARGWAAGRASAWQVHWLPPLPASPCAPALYLIGPSSPRDTRAPNTAHPAKAAPSASPCRKTWANGAGQRCWATVLGKSQRAARGPADSHSHTVQKPHIQRERSLPNWYRVSKGRFNLSRCQGH